MHIHYWWMAQSLIVYRGIPVESKKAFAAELFAQSADGFFLNARNIAHRLFEVEEILCLKGRNQSDHRRKLNLLGSEQGFCEFYVF